MDKERLQVVVDWLKENVGDKIQIMTPQFERVEKLENQYVPKDEAEFNLVWDIIKSAPWKVLKGMGFGKWDTMNNIIEENMGKDKCKVVSIPIINSDENLTVDIGYKDAPTEPLGQDMDVILFPGEWYNVIPEGFIVTGLFGEQYPHKKDKAANDIRFGCLAYGFQRPVIN